MMVNREVVFSMVLYLNYDGTRSKYLRFSDWSTHQLYKAIAQKVLNLKRQLSSTCMYTTLVECGSEEAIGFFVVYLTDFSANWFLDYC